MTAKTELKSVPYTEGVGRRKRAVARVRIYKTKGAITVNDKPLAVHFPEAVQQAAVSEPLERLGRADAVTVSIHVRGGGKTAQAEAARLGVARALVLDTPEARAELRGGGFLTRDPREKERNKYGLVRARKARQFRKR